MSDDANTLSTDVDVDASDNLKSVRDFAKAQEKRAKQAEKDKEELEARLAALESEKAQGAIKDAAKAKGLSDEQVATLLALNPNPSAEALEAYAAAVGVAPAEDGEEIAPVAGTPTFPTPAAGSPLPSKPFTSQDVVDAVMRGDIATADKMVAEAVRNPSRLQFKHPNMIEP